MGHRAEQRHAPKAQRAKAGLVAVQPADDGLLVHAANLSEPMRIVNSPLSYTPAPA
jgi:hypothetical protein